MSTTQRYAHLQDDTLRKATETITIYRFNITKETSGAGIIKQQLQRHGRRYNRGGYYIAPYNTAEVIAWQSAQLCGKLLEQAYKVRIP